MSSSEEIDLIVGSPGYYRFSTNITQYNPLLKFIDIVTQLKPRFAVIETSAKLLYSSLENTHESDDAVNCFTLNEDIFIVIYKLRQAGYEVNINFCNTADFGSVEQQKLVVITCNHQEKELPYLSQTHTNNNLNELPKWKTLRDVIKGISNNKSNCINLSETEKNIIVFSSRGKLAKFTNRYTKRSTSKSSYTFFWR